MATKIWRGDAPAVAQVNTWLFAGTWEANDVVNVTINGKVVSVVAGSTSAATVASTVQAALAASTITEFAEITWEVNSATITGTSKTAGEPFTATFATTETGGGAADSQTINGSTSSTGTAATACSGPNWANLAANWDGGLPADGDDVVFADSASDVLYGLDMSGVTPNTITFDQTFTGAVGLPRYHTVNGLEQYYEYRDRYLKFGNSGDANPTTITIGRGGDSAGGSPRLLLDSGTGQVTLNVLGSGTPESGQEVAIFWKGSHASNAVNVNKGFVGIATFPGETATVATLRVGYQENPAGDARVICGKGVTLTTISQSGGTLQTESNIDTASLTDGELKHLAGTMATLNLDGGACRYRSTGTLTTANVGSGGNLDFRQDLRPRTVTNINLYEGFEIHDPFGTVTPTNGFDFVRCTPADGVFDVVPHQTFTPSAI